MLYLNLEPVTNRILSVATYTEPPEGMVAVKYAPEFASDYLYIDGEFIYDPLPQPDPIPDDEITDIDKLEAQVTYTAMMTNTLLEVE